MESFSMKIKILLEIPGKMYADQECDPPRNVQIYHVPEDVEHPFWASYEGNNGDVGRWPMFKLMLDWVRAEIVRSMSLK